MSYEYNALTGVIVPDTADTREEVAQEWRDAFGRSDLDVSAHTPQGVLITAETLARQGAARLTAEVANQINPNAAGGIFLDALCALMGLERRRATYTTVQGVTLTGQPQTNIPAGARAQTEAGDTFALVSGVLIGASGTATGEFRATEPGEIACDAGALEYITDSILGWETVSNPNAGTVGAEEETDYELALRRQVTLGRQGISSVESHISALYDLPGVRSLSFRENISNDTEVIDGITMLPHSVWACVEGGTDAEIAESLFRTKTNGAAWNGAVSVEVLEPYSGQTYEVQFDRPTQRPVVIRVTLKSSVSANVQDLARQAIVDYAAGKQQGERGFVVGASVSPYELGAAINRDAPEIHVILVELAFVGDDYQTATLPIAVNELATVTPSSITIIEQ
jgi:uncharacterized phage protein gp47/JayE